MGQKGCWGSLRGTKAELYNMKDHPKELPNSLDSNSEGVALVVFLQIENLKIIALTWKRGST